jgi:16S rRNA processing protein RimM
LNRNGDILIGKIIGAHGTNGTSRVYSFAESIDIFKAGRTIGIRSPDGQHASFEISWVKPHKRILLLALKGVTDRNQAEALIGSELLIEKASLPKLKDGDYYWFEIIGLSVFNLDDEFLGHVTSILPTGSNDVYVVQNVTTKNREEILIPALESVVVEINIDQKLMRVNLPEGLR